MLDSFYLNKMAATVNSNITEKSTQLFFSLVKDTLTLGFDSAELQLKHTSNGLFCALWVHTGRIEINGDPLNTGSGTDVSSSDTIVNRGSDTAIILRFIISVKPLVAENATDENKIDCQLIFSTPFSIASSSEMLLRLDQVDFPPRAVAYRHTHPGPGIRYLVDGGLTLVSDHNEQTIKRGEAWFEDANSPVKAIATEDCSSYFVRTMLLPLEFEGRSTFTLCGSADADKPRKQSNIRHFEKRINMSEIY